jgi:hypothetical protein
MKAPPPAARRLTFSLPYRPAIVYYRVKIPVVFISRREVLGVRGEGKGLVEGVVAVGGDIRAPSTRA